MFLTVYVFNNSDLIPFNFPFFQTDFQGQERNILNDKIYFLILAGDQLKVSIVRVSLLVLEDNSEIPRSSL